ncbi:serine/threonine-protein kinase [Streptomyces sp. NPDC049585]|uniref:serine/threonine protein kinase n=1 Tax=Streptomyces sp. NPDC049585 TaxID=3155154 RepID=UPI0034485EA2
MEALRPQDPTSIGTHTVLARLGAGGMGQVYLGRSPGGRQVALKVIREDFAESPEALARFRREVETVRAVRSAYTANIIDASLAAPPYWLATEYVPGPTLMEAIRRRGGPLAAGTCFRLFAALAEALASVHAYGVLHRDLKPQNVILSGVGPKLIDFGIARGAEHTALTRTGAMPGTPGYGAPETLTRDDVSTASDVFALGATMATAATGRPPYGQGTLESVLYRVVHGEVDVDHVEPALAELIRACVARDPGERPALSEVIARCGVTSALVEDPEYQALVGAVASPVPAAPPVPTYVPTVVPHAAAPASQRRPRSRTWLMVGAAVVAVGAGAGVTAQLLDGKAGGSAEQQAAKPAAATPSSRGGSSSGPAAAPAYIEDTDLNREFWSPSKDDKFGGGGSCGLPSEERGGQQFQFSIADPAHTSVQEMSGKVEIQFRFKYGDEKILGKPPYYVSVAVKPPHDINRETGKPYPNLMQPNLSVGYTSKPVDIFPTKGWGSDFVKLTYPDDFKSYVDGKVYSPAIPIDNDPGNWTVIFYHVKGPKEYRSVMCDGFVGK